MILLINTWDDIGIRTQPTGDGTTYQTTVSEGQKTIFDQPTLNIHAARWAHKHLCDLIEKGGAKGLAVLKHTEPQTPFSISAAEAKRRGVA